MVRWAAFPVIFSAVLVLAAATFYNRRTLLPGSDESRLQKVIESHQQAVEFKARVAEGVKREREKKIL